MTTVTFTLNQNNELVMIDNLTGFPSTIPVSLEGLQKLQKLLKVSDEAMVKKYQKMWEIQHAEEEELQKNFEAIRKQRQIDELGELF